MVIRGEKPEMADSGAEQELESERHTINKYIHIKIKEGTPSYGVYWQKKMKSDIFYP